MAGAHLSKFIALFHFLELVRYKEMEENSPERSGAQSRVSSAASSHYNEEDHGDEDVEVRASPTSLVSLQ